MKVMLASGIAAVSAETLAAKAHRAAVRKKEFDCLTLLWALRDLPREKSVLKAINKSRHGTSGASSMTLLQAASASGMEKSVDLLLDFPAKVNLKNEEGLSAIHLAAKFNFKRVVQVLVTKGSAPIDARDAQGRTALHIAAELGHQAVCRVLVNFCWNPYAEDAETRTAIESAKEKNTQLADWMTAHAKKMRKRSDIIGLVRSSQHTVAPKLVMTPVGYCPEEDGKVIQFKSGVRSPYKSRRGPTQPKGYVNWYAPRG